MSYKIRGKVLFSYSLTWLIPLAILVLIYLIFTDIRFSEYLSNVYIVLSIIVVAPSLIIFIAYFIRDRKSKIDISKGYIKRRNHNKNEVLINSSEIEKIIRVSSYFENSSGYGSLFFLGGSFYYYRIVDKTNSKKIEATCLLVDEWAFNKFEIIEEKVIFPL